jgi:CHAT domain-containing protein/Arc/MetJ-type ribon-helix-helix transcriptional regulator
MSVSNAGIWKQKAQKMRLRSAFIFICLIGNAQDLLAQPSSFSSKERDAASQSKSKYADTSDALKNAKLELELYRKQINQVPEDLARILNKVGTLAFDRDDFLLAKAMYLESIDTLEKAGLSLSLNAATALQNLAVLSENAGDYPAAIGHRRKSLGIKEKIFGLEHADIATAKMELANDLTSIGQYAEAGKLDLEAFDLRIKLFGNESLEIAEIMVEICQDCVNLGDYKNASDFGSQALKIQQGSLDRSHPDLARTHSIIGILDSRRGEFEAAESNFKKALSIYRRVRGADHPMVGQVMIHLGQAQRLQGKLAKAVDTFEKSASILASSRGESHPDVAVPLYGVAESAFLMQDFPKALEACDKARRITRQHFASVLPYLPEQELLTFVDDEDTDRFAKIMSASLLLLGDEKVAELSATWALNHKGIVQVALSEQNRMLNQIVDPKQTKNREKLQLLRQQLAQLSMVSNESFDLIKMNDQRERLTIEIDALVRDLTLGLSTADSSEPWIELNDVRKSLAQETYVVQFVRFNRYLFQGETDWGPAHYLAWVIPPANGDPVSMIDLGPAEPIDKIVAKVRGDIAKAGGPEGSIKRDGEEQVSSSSEKVMAELGSKTFLPIAPHVRSAKQLVLSPDAALWLAPWASLPTEDGSQYLIEKLALSFAISPRDLVRKGKLNNNQQAPLIFANPRFDLTPDGVWTSIRAVLDTRAPTESDRQRSFKPTSTHRFSKVLPLPNTAIEAEMIAPSLESYTGIAPIRYLDRYALETVVKAAYRPKVLVFGTHGFFLDESKTNAKDSNSSRDAADSRNPLLRCGLLLAGCKDQTAGTGTAGDDGVLTGLEIGGLQLEGTELVVLSACETAVGSVRNGEGVASLCQAFHLAGAKSVVATLWTVPDRDTALLINKFMAELASGKSKPEALRNAQLDRIQKRRERYGAAHPYFWAAVTVSEN